jgi:GNAT superfamily N-acetyltransferase
MYKAISILKLDDNGWGKYYSLNEKIDGAQHIDIAHSSVKIGEFKKNRLSDLELNNDRAQNEYVIFNDDTAIGWLAYRLDRRGSSFTFNTIYAPVPVDFMRLILKTVYDFINQKGEEASFYWSFDENCISALKNINAPVFEEMMITHISRNEMDAKFYNNIIDQTNTDGYKLMFFNTVPEELLDKYVQLRNEISEDMAELKPVKHLNKRWTKNDIIRMAETDKLEEAQMWMYMLLDKNDDIAAFCSLYIDKDKPEVIRQSGGLTAVARRHRGKGFAAYLKAKMYLKLLEENNDFKFVETDTMPWNTYMYRINERFGFKPHTYGSEFRIHKDFLENYLGIS